MTDNVVRLEVDNVCEFPAETILRDVIEAKPDKVLVLSLEQDGKVLAWSSTSYGPDLLWMLERGKLLIMKNILEQEAMPEHAWEGTILPFPPDVA